MGTCATITITTENLSCDGQPHNTRRCNQTTGFYEDCNNGVWMPSTEICGCINPYGLLGYEDCRTPDVYTCQLSQGTYQWVLTGPGQCEVVAPPVSSFVNQVSGLTVTFTDASTSFPTTWLWDFGDGQQSTEKNPTHTYATTGTYKVTLTVSNSAGLDTSTPIDVTAGETTGCTNPAGNLNTITCADGKEYQCTTTGWQLTGNVCGGPNIGLIALAVIGVGLIGYVLVAR